MDERSQLEKTGLARVLIQDYHKDPEQQRSDGYRQYDASSDDAEPLSGESRSLQSDVDGIGARRFPSGAPERGWRFDSSFCVEV